MTQAYLSITFLALAFSFIQFFFSSFDCFSCLLSHSFSCHHAFARVVNSYRKCWVNLVTDAILNQIQLNSTKYEVNENSSGRTECMFLSQHTPHGVEWYFEALWWWQKQALAHEKNGHIVTDAHKQIWKVHHCWCGSLEQFHCDVIQPFYRNWLY